MKVINNTYKTETILDMGASTEVIAFVKKLELKPAIQLMLLDLLSEARRVGGKDKENYLLRKYKKWIDSTL